MDDIPDLIHKSKVGTIVILNDEQQVIGLLTKSDIISGIQLQSIDCKTIVAGDTSFQ